MVIRSPAFRRIGSPDFTSTVWLLMGSFTVGANALEGVDGQTWNSTSPQRTMMSSLRLWWQWVGVVQPLRAYMIRSEYSGHDDSITSTRAYCSGLPMPKSVGSKTTPGGSTQPCSAKQRAASRAILFNTLRF